MKVLVVDGSDRGGIARYTDRLVSGLLDAGVDVPLAAPPPRSRNAPPIPAVRWGEEIAGWSTPRLYATRFSEVAKRSRAFLGAVRSTAPDVVHLQTEVARRLDPLLLRAARRRAPIVLTIHNAVAHEGGAREAARQHRRWRAADVLIVHDEAASVAVATAVPGADVRVIGVDAPTRPNLERRRAARQGARAALGLPPDAPIALMLGMLRPYKGLDVLVGAWPRIAARATEARLYVVGSAPKRFAALDDLGALDGVSLREGWLADDDMDRWAAAADVVVLPYAHGSHSAILHRVAAQGTPVVAAPALAAEVGRLGAGLVAERAPDPFAAAVLDVFERRWVPREGHPAADGSVGMVDAHVRVYEGLLGGRPGGNAVSERTLSSADGPPRRRT